MLEMENKEKDLALIDKEVKEKLIPWMAKSKMNPKVVSFILMATGEAYRKLKEEE